MKKIIVLCSLIFVIFLTGCGVYKEDDVISDIEKKINKSTSYYLEGTMEIINNEETYKYDVNVSYQTKDNYKVDLVNQTNNHEQVILRNDEGVYVITHKSTKY